MDRLKWTTLNIPVLAPSPRRGYPQRFPARATASRVLPRPFAKAGLRKGCNTRTRKCCGARISVWEIVQVFYGGRRISSYIKCKKNRFWKKSIFTQIRHLILYISHNKGYVDDFVGELTF